jgi:hypothetical protein
MVYEADTAGAGGAPPYAGKLLKQYNLRTYQWFDVNPGGPPIRDLVDRVIEETGALCMDRQATV